MAGIEGTSQKEIREKRGEDEMRKLIFCILTGFLVYITYGCSVSPRINWSDINDITSHITRTRDEYQKVILYNGPKYGEEYNDFRFEKMTAIHIRAFRMEDSIVPGIPNIAYQIYVVSIYEGDWKFYEYAYDIDGAELDVQVIDRDVAGCSLSSCIQEEHIAINISPYYLMSHQDTGIKFKIIGKRGEKELFVPATYIKAFMSISTK